MIVLTGAGFTKNFGGYLAKEVWARILSHRLIQKNPNVRERLLKNFDYEFVHSGIASSGIQTDLDDYRTAIEDTFTRMDSKLAVWNMNADHPEAFDHRRLAEMFRTVQGANKHMYMFTLNQDVQMERLYKHNSIGAPQFTGDFYHRYRPLEHKEFVTLPAEFTIQNIQQYISSVNGIVYFKLHGSYGWLSGDQQSAMIIGMNKEEELRKYPLLSAYLDFFEKTLFQPNQKILIIGYGFGDSHINKILARAIKEFGLKIMVVSPMSPDGLQKQLYGQYPDIWSAVYGYLQFDLHQLLPVSQFHTEHLVEFRDIWNAI